MDEIDGFSTFYEKERLKDQRHRRRSERDEQRVVDLMEDCAIK